MKSDRSWRSGEQPGILEKIYIPPKQIKIGNIEWCKKCQAMMAEMENLCFVERNAIPDELFQDTFCLFNNCWYSDWKISPAVGGIYSKILERCLRRSLLKKQPSKGVFKETSLIESGFVRYRVNKIHFTKDNFIRIFLKLPTHLVLQTHFGHKKFSNSYFHKFFSMAVL